MKYESSDEISVDVKKSYIDTIKIKSRKSLIFHILFPISLILLLIFSSQNKNEFLYYSMITFLETLLSISLISLYLFEDKLDKNPKMKKKVKIMGNTLIFFIVIIFFYLYFNNVEY